MSHASSSIQLDRYTTLRVRGESCLDVKRSRFLGVALPLDQADAADQALAAIRQAHRGARHIAFAYRVFQPVHYARLSDDGEPKGTAGPPLLALLEGRHLTQCGVFVVRYFGGVLLGTGGLVRAYSQAAEDALIAAGTVTMVKMQGFEVTLPYDVVERVRDALERLGVEIATCTYAERVTWRGFVHPQRYDAAVACLQEATSGHAVVVPCDDSYRPLGKDATIQRL